MGVCRRNAWRGHTNTMLKFERHAKLAVVHANSQLSGRLREGWCRK